MRFGWPVVVWVLTAGTLPVALGQQEARPAAPAATAPATRPFAIAKETTYYTAPVRADGTIDYAEAINERLGRGVTPENNAAVPLLDAIQAGNADMPAHYVRVREKLGIPARPALKPLDGVAGDGEPEGYDFAMQNPWTPEKAPAMAKWVEAYGPRLDKVVEASRRTRYYMPLVREQARDTVVDVLLPHLNVMRGLANALKARAMLALGKEDMEAFRRDVVALVRISRLTSHGPTLVERLVAIGCEATGLEAIQIAATGGWLSAADVERILAELRDVPSMRAHDVFELGERTFMLEFLQIAAVHGVGEASRMFQNMAGGGGGQNRNDATAAPMPPVDPAAKDWNAAMRKANAWYDRLAAAGKQPTYPERERALDAVMRDVDAVRQRLTGWRGIFAPVEDRMVTMALPAFNRAFLVEARLDRDRVMTQVALALSAFRAKTGEYPATLKELVPAYFPAEPVDPLTAKPLAYRTEAGGYELQSLGENGRADKGPKSDDKLLRAER
jgi:hypothetical protein